MIILSGCSKAGVGNEFDKSLSSKKIKGSFPGVGMLDEKLQNKFKEMRKKRGANYKPRTKHLDKKGWAEFTNRLFLETSPYLLQHAHNPVNWYSWGEEAFKNAKELNRPILLSIGYSTCHWCHVMEEESFEDKEIAKFINQNYIAIKVDREERPDIDAIYMAAVQAITGHGGWPMTVWLTPDKEPIYGATYIPARDGDRGIRIGFLTMLKNFKQMYDNDPEKVAISAKDVSKFVSERLEISNVGDLPDEFSLHNAISFYKENFDETYGGMSGQPKFPSSFPNHLFLRYYRRTKDKKYLEMAEKTLTKMANGGMYDHVGGGFHRYSTDNRWLVPHFEKMLYDNALLATVYTEAYQATGNKEYKKVTKEILDYILRDMTSPDGGFYSATDADSIGPKGHREEGYYFTWTPHEIDQTLSKKEASLIKSYYGITSKGNFEEGRTILNISKPLKTVAKLNELAEKEAQNIIDQAREKLYQEREKRPPVIRDEKILTAWNGLAISAFANASFVYNEPKYKKVAQKAATFILNNLMKEKRLYRSFKDGQAKLRAYLDDYAFLIAGLMDLYEATNEIKWLKEAISLDQTLEKYYEDKKNGGFFMTSSDHEKLLAREKPAYDGAEPSGNSVQIMNLLRLHKFTSSDSYRKRSVSGFKAFSNILKQNPIALSEMLLALDFYLDRSKEIIIVFPEESEISNSSLLEVLRETFLPNRIMSFISEGKMQEEHLKVIPLVYKKYARKKKPTAYVCDQGRCKFPTTDPDTFKSQINTSSPFTKK